MRDHMHFASARRDDRLSRVRKLTLWIAGGAAAASLGLGTAFAHAIPGHAAGSQSAGSAPAATGSPGTGGSAGTGTTGSGAGGTVTGGKHRHHHALAPPEQPPSQAPAPAPPVVHSGGS